MSDVRVCNICEGTGLEGVSRTKYGDCSWDGHSFCDKCKGIGYLEWKETMLHKLCTKCKGSGHKKEYPYECDHCKGEGVVDWLTYMRIGKNE